MRNVMILMSIIFLLVALSGIIYIFFFSKVKLNLVLDKEEKKSLEQKLKE